MSKEAGFIDIVLSDPIATAACFVAFLAVFIAIWQGYEQRRHNRLSVRPLLSRITRNGKGANLSISLKNMGLGAAIIKDVHFSIDGRKYEVSNVSDYSKLFYAVGVQHLAGQFLCCSVGKQAVLAPNDSVNLIELPEGAYDENEHVDIITALSKIRVDANYESIYKEKFTTKLEQP
ncbi:hypothetical protein ABXV18_06790 [Vibrio owensii]|uniref:hypothetical protein n=1 Tax=Vibrio owensii TaxID=696485 RepID=UPI003390BD7B